MILGVTGHRPDKLGGWDDRDNPIANAVRGRLRAELERLKPAHVITGMALGVDVWVAQLCVDMFIPFIAYVPFEGQDSRWPMFSRWRYTNLLYKAQRLVTISERKPVSNIDAVNMMHARNKRIVDDSDRLLAVFDGSSGGTYNTVKYALTSGRPIEWLRPPWVVPT